MEKGGSRGGHAGGSSGGRRDDGGGNQRNTTGRANGGPNNFSPRGAQWTSEKLPHEKCSTGKSSGWEPLADERKDITLPPKRDVAKEYKELIDVKVNHFPIQIQFPENIFVYKVKISKVRNNPETGASKKDEKFEKKGGVDPENNPGGGEAPARPLPKFVTAKVMKTLVENLELAYAAAAKGKRKIVLASDKVDILYSVKKLEEHVNIGNPIEVEVRMDGPEGNAQTFSVQFMLASIGCVDSGALQHFVDLERGAMRGKKASPDLKRVESIYNVLMKNLRGALYTPVDGNSLICFDNGQPLGNGLTNYPGYDAIVEISGCWQPLLNVQATNLATVTVNMNVIDLFAELFHRSRRNCLDIESWDCYDFRTATRLLRSCRVRYSPQPGMTISGVVTRVENGSVSTIEFPLNVNGVETMSSVYDYFVRQYDRIDLDRNGPCLLLNGRNHVPAQLCVVKDGQSVNRGFTLDEDQRRQMLLQAKKEPSQLVAHIHRSIDELGLRTDPVLKEFGLTFAKDVRMLSVMKTRVLASPQICYGGKSNGDDQRPGRSNGNQRMVVTPQTGIWNLSGAEFFAPSAPVNKWGILITCAITDRTRREITREATSRFKELLQSKGDDVGLHLVSEPIVRTELLQDNSSQETLQENVEVLKSLFGGTDDFKGCQIVMVVIPSKGCAVYTHVKQAAELSSETAMLTQCVTRDVFASQGPRLATIVGNILLKMNSKLGGVNHVVRSPIDLSTQFTIFQEPVLILGADVNHPPPGSFREGEVAKSFAAVTCTIDKSGMPSLMHVQAQTKAERNAAEVVKGFDTIIKNCLLKYHAMTGLKPVKIIYYRDGVGEGQFPELLDEEMRKIRDGCALLGANYKPAITFVTVQKRHKTRIFMRDTHTPGSYLNPPPGTVVDSQIVHPTEHDFYLVSHKGLMGTSRPTRYHVLWDDSRFTSDTLQQLTYYLCCMYVRCNKSVSIPAPAYYAHWSAKRAKVLAEGNSEKTVEEVNAILHASHRLLSSYPMHFI